MWNVAQSKSYMKKDPVRPRIFPRDSAELRFSLEDPEVHKELLRRATEGDERAIQIFWEAYRCKVYTREEIKELEPIIRKENEEKKKREGGYGEGKA